MGSKRQDYLTWDEYFMGVAMLSAMRSKDPGTQVGACIVSPDNKILSMGYNGFPIGCSDDEFPWNREGEPLDSKYLYTTHSELNAILNYRGGSLEGQSCMFPCFPAMNARRQLSSQASKPWCMTATNIRIRPLSLPPSGCWTQRECGIISIHIRSGK